MSDPKSPISDPQLAQYNVIASFPREEQARKAVQELHDQGVPSEEISYLGASAEERAEHLEGAKDGDPSSEGIAEPVTKGVVGGGAAGGAVGGAAGFLAGLIAVGIPGAGPLIGAGVWATTAYGAAAGATVGGIGSGLTQMWERHYQDVVAGGGALVGVHSDDQMRVHEAALSMEKEGPTRIDHLDPEGKVLDE